MTQAMPLAAGAPAKAAIESLSQWQLIRRRFARHRLAVVSLFVLAVVYGLAAFAEFFAPYPAMWRNLDYIYCPPQPPRFSRADGLHVYAVERCVDPVTFHKIYVEHPERPVPLVFFAKGEPYALWGLIRMERHFLGVDLEAYGQRYGDAAGGAEPPSVVSAAKGTARFSELHEKGAAPFASASTANGGCAIVPTFYLFGGDKYGRDIFSRIVHGSRISLSIGLVAITITFLLGVSIGGVSGYLGGAADNLIQRVIEIINAFPRLPMWLALAAVMPPDWSPLRVYFAITVVLSLLGWTGLARVVRGKLLALREEDYAVAARLIGASHSRIIFRHLLPGFTSHIIVTLTLSVPGMILGETALSFLGLGLRPPVVSWGVMLQDAMSMQTVANYPWLLAPVVFIVLTVLCFNYAGDGMRDAADPYSSV